MHWATIITSTGALLGGLAIVIAFIQLDAQRRERLREQVSKIGVWTRIYALSAGGERPALRILVSEPAPEQWRVDLLVRNSSELPVLINRVELNVTPWGYDLVPTDAGPNPYANKRFGGTTAIPLFLGEAIEPEGTRVESVPPMSSASLPFDQPQTPKVSINVIVITDAAGHLWEMRPSRARPPRRVRWWRRKGIL